MASSRPLPDVRKVSIEAIRLGDGYRKEMGEIDALARSLGKRGLIHPVLVLPDMRLVSGYRRVAAALRIGWTEIDVIFVETLAEIAERMSTERMEATNRKAMRPSENAALATDLGKITLGVKDPRTYGGEVRRQIGIALGTSESAVGRLIRVLALANGDDRFKRHAALDTLKKMDYTGTVEMPIRELSEKLGGLGRGPIVFNHGTSPRKSREESRQTTVPQQRIALDRLITMMGNLGAAVSYVGEVHPDLPPGEAATFAEELRRAKKPLAQLVNQLLRKSRE